MTVAELISELQKYPSHYTAVLEVIDESNPEALGAETYCGFIDGVEFESNVGDIGPWVKIIQQRHLP